MNKNRLIKNFFSLLSLRGLEFLVPLLTIPYQLRVIGVEKYGLIGFSYSFAVYFGAIIQYGFGVTATRDVARRRQDEKAISVLYSTVLAASLLLAFAAMIIAALILLVFSNMRNNLSLNLLSLLLVMIQSLFPIWFFQGTERMKYITYLNMVSKLLFLVGLLVFVHAPVDYLIIPIINILSSFAVLVGAILIIHYNFGIRIVCISWRLIWECLKSGRHSFVNQFAPNLYNNSVVFILGIVFGGNAVGLYSSATRVVDAVSSLGYILSNTFLPYLSRSMDNHIIFRKIMLIVGGFCSMLLFVMADMIGCFLHPSYGLKIAFLIRMTCFSVFMIFVMLTYGTNYLMLKGGEEQTARITLFASISFFIISLILIPRYGIVGGLITLVGARSVIAAAIYFVYRRMAHSLEYDALQ
ncbi:oligosaccharide flippase family protein [Candidatus Roizmanbacteria bacterium]|nr:oligosaccharide flippase family protein [Candidatus Roizmanbacteria bacterium]